MRLIFPVIFLMACTSACVRNAPQIVVVTATATVSNDAQVLGGSTLAPDNVLPPSVVESENSPTPNPARPVKSSAGGNQYIVQPGDTLSGIASDHGVSLETLLAVNNITDPNVISVGQVIELPAPPDEETDSFKIIPDSRLVRGPSSHDFDIAAFVAQQPGFIRSATDTIDDQSYSAAQVIERVSLEFSVDARMLLALLEYKSGWLTQTNISDDFKTYPIQGAPSTDGFDRHGLYLQLSWAANQLNRGYYGWKDNGLSVLEFEDKTRLLYASGLNAGTVAVQYFLSLNNTYPNWVQQVTPDGFYRSYSAYFGDPFNDSIDTLVPPDITQPPMEFPFSTGQTWFFTGGAHGGWGSGSAWAAIDFAPPDDRPDGSPPCYVSEFWSTAVAPGVIARSSDGVVILDLDGDGDEATGWSILYLHMASEGRIEAGKQVNVGDLLGHPSCEGGFSNAMHMHIARRYNGEWIPVSCDACLPGYETPPLMLSGWTVYGLTGQEYQGYMVKNGEQRRAEQGRLTPENRVSW